ncbi:MAG: flagellar motor switch protein FliN [Phycisphaerales bacterium JB060]
MPEERPEEQDAPQPEDARRPEGGGSKADTGSSDDETSEALKAAKEALSSIQAEADAAMGGDGSSKDSADGDDESVAAAVVQAALKAAQAKGGSADAGTPLELPDFDLSSVAGAQHGLDMLADVQLDVRIELGRTRMLVEDVLRLNSGAVVELDKLAGDPLDVYVNDRLVARGEVLVLNDNFCIRVNEIIDSLGEQPGEGVESTD